MSCINIVNISSRNVRFWLIKECSIFSTKTDCSCRARLVFGLYCYAAFNAIIEFASHHIGNSIRRLNNRLCMDDIGFYDFGEYYTNFETITVPIRNPPLTFF